MNDALERRRLASAPDATGLQTGHLRSLDEVAAAAIVLEPVRMADSEVLSVGDRQRAERDHVVDRHGHVALGHLVVEGFARMIAHLVSHLEHGVGYHVLGAETFLDVGEVAPGRLDEEDALAPAPLNDLEAEAGGTPIGVPSGELRHLLERIHGVVVDAGSGVGQTLFGVTH